MALSPYYTDAVVVTQLRSYFNYNTMWTIDFYPFLEQVTDYDKDFYFLEVKGKQFKIHRIAGFVLCLNPDPIPVKPAAKKKSNKKKKSKKDKKKKKKKRKK